MRRTYGRNSDTSINRDLRTFAHSAAERGTDVELPTTNVELALSVEGQAVVRDFLLQLLAYGRPGPGIISFIRGWEPAPRSAQELARAIGTLAVRLPVLANRTKQLQELLRVTAERLVPDLHIEHDFDSDDDSTEQGEYVWVALSGPLSSG